MTFIMRDIHGVPFRPSSYSQDKSKLQEQLYILRSKAKEAAVKQTRQQEPNNAGEATDAMIDAQNKVIEALDGPMSRKDIVEATGMASERLRWILRRPDMADRMNIERVGGKFIYSRK